MSGLSALADNAHGPMPLWNLLVLKQSKAPPVQTVVNFIGSRASFDR